MRTIGLAAAKMVAGGKRVPHQQAQRDGIKYGSVSSCTFSLPSCHGHGLTGTQQARHIAWEFEGAAAPDWTTW